MTPPKILLFVTALAVGTCWPLQVAAQGDERVLIGLDRVVEGGGERRGGGLHKEGGGRGGGGTSGPVRDDDAPNVVTTKSRGQRVWAGAAGVFGGQLRRWRLVV